MTSKVYVYGIGRRSDGLEPSIHGLEREDVRSLDFGELRVFASEISDAEIMATRRHMLTHARVLEHVMESGPILPFRFGMIVSQSSLEAGLIGMQETNLLSSLKDLEGRSEIGIRIVLNEKAIMEQIVEDNSDLKSAYEALSARDPQQTHYQRIELGRQVHAALAQRKDAIGAEFLQEIQSRCEQVKESERTTDYEALHVACLTTSDEERGILEFLESADSSANDLYTIKVIAPVPPYNFVDLKLATGDELAA